MENRKKVYATLSSGSSGLSSRLFSPLSSRARCRIMCLAKIGRLHPFGQGHITSGRGTFFSSRANPARSHWYSFPSNLRVNTPGENGSKYLSFSWSSLTALVSAYSFNSACSSSSVFCLSSSSKCFTRAFFFTTQPCTRFITFEPRRCLSVACGGEGSVLPTSPSSNSASGLLPDQFAGCVLFLAVSLGKR